MAAKKGHLSVAPAGARAKKAEPKNISEALDGTARDVLVAMRRALARQLDDGSIASNAISSAYKELRELDRLIRIADHESEREAVESRGYVDNRFDASAI